MNPGHRNGKPQADKATEASDKLAAEAARADLTARLEHAHRRLERLNEISKLFASFETIEKTFDAALGIVAKTLPLRSAILIEKEGDQSRMIFWPSRDENSETMQVAKEHAQQAYVYLTGPASMDAADLSKQAGMTMLPVPPGMESTASNDQRFIVLPLVVSHCPAFGILQFAGLDFLNKEDLIFINAISNQLAITLDRDRLWRQNLARREQAESGQAAAEAKGETSERQRIEAENAATRHEALARKNRRLYEQAQQAIHVREQILAVVSHDLKSPLGSILITTELLLRQIAQDNERPQVLPEALERVYRAAVRIRRLIEDLLDFASIEAGQLALSSEPLEPEVLIHEALASLEILGREKDLRLTAEFEPQLPRVYCDRERILQIFSNLVSNSINATPKGGHITLRVTAQQHELVFSVSDTGQGISAEEIKHLFQRYWRSEESQYKGTGLGLAIVGMLVNAHGGRIWATSELGQGTTIFFTLPAAEP